MGREVEVLLGPPTPEPPSLWPGVPKVLPPPGPASLTAFSTAAARAGGLAPWIVLTTEPLWRTRKVGMARTLYFWATSRWLSTLTLQNVIFLGLEYLVERDSKAGAIVLHGPHQSA